MVVSKFLSIMWVCYILNTMYWNGLIACLIVLANNKYEITNYSSPNFIHLILTTMALYTLIYL